MKKSNTLERIKEWYRPDNYRAADDFPDSQIATLLWPRHLLDRWAGNGRNITAENCEIYRNLLNGSLLTDCPTECPAEYSAPVLPLGCDDVLEMAAELRKHQREPADDLCDFEIEPYDFFEAEATPYNEGGGYAPVALTVDLAASDDLIIESMKAFLPAYRKALGYPGFNPNTNTGKATGWKNWVARIKSHRILDIVDVCLWGKINNVEIRESVLAKLIYGDVEKGGSEEDVRKTYIPMAQQALARRRISALFYQGQHKITEKNR